MKTKSITFSSHPSSAHLMTTYQAGVLQASVHRSLQKYCDIILKPYAITKAQWLLIGTVLDSGNHGITVSDLALTLDTTMAYLTNTINLLESKYILVRTTSDQDSRAKMITIHPSFVDTCDEIEIVLRDGLRRLVYSGISNRDFDTYLRVLLQLSTLQKSTIAKTKL